MKKNIIQEKSYAFAVRIVKLSKFLSEEKKEYILSRQILKSGTSVGANVEEGIVGQSKKDFISKFSIALKEAKETHYWLRLLHDCEYIGTEVFNSLIKDCDEVIIILTRILQTSRKNLNS